jgi:LPS-assembly protein
MVRLSVVIILCVSTDLFSAVPPARAQAPAQPQAAQSGIGGCRASQMQYLTFQTITPDHLRLDGTPDIPVQIDCDEAQFFAEHMEIFRDTNLVRAWGNVVFVSGNNKITAERMDFNTQTRTGTFYVASGTATLGNRVERSMFGTQEPDAYFWGEELEKVGPKKYKITRGGFTACVQPTPRWELISGTATINLDDYALLTNALFKVKNVPVMYLPVFYYPIQDDDRATGFIMPIYGTSTLRGHTLTNQFFWAINRSQDATFSHDWFSKTGQGYGAEYRFIASPSSDGNARLHIIREKPTTIDGVPGEGQRSFDIRGSARHQLPWNTRLAARADYVSRMSTRQLYHQNPYEWSSRTRDFGVSTSTNFSGFSLTSEVGRREYFNGETLQGATGSQPRVILSRAPARLGRAPIFVQAGADYGNLYTQRLGTGLQDRSLRRFDMGGGLRVPFPTFSFLTINSTLNWQGTHYSKSLGPPGPNNEEVVVDTSLFRDYFAVGTEIVGPVFTRIWNRPNSRFAERIKHLIEPSVRVTRTSAVEEFARIIRDQPGDFEVGGSFRTLYALTSRFLRKPGGDRGVSRELLRIRVEQTHYGNPQASNFDPNYNTNFLRGDARSFSPVSLSASVNPAEGSSANLKLEYDPKISGFGTISAGGSIVRRLFDATGLYSRSRRLIFGETFRVDNLVSGGAKLRSPRNSIGGNYGFHYDISNSTLVEQRILGYYNAQCCGITLEYQALNYGARFASTIPEDRRFNISFTLAGIGTFSNFLGALTGQPDRR